jgi:hypothetical protein
MESVAQEIEKATKREDGEDFPPQAFAYVPDPEAPSTWKLRLWDSLSEKETAAQVGRAVAALGPGGFRGNRVQIPEEDLEEVRAKVLAAWRRTHPEAEAEDAPAILKGYGYEMKDDDMGDGEVDPLDELLDAYQSFVRMGNGELADEAMSLVHELQALMLGVERSAYLTAKNHGYSNPVACLSQAHLALLVYPSAADLRGKILRLIERATEVIYEERTGEEAGNGMEENMDAAGPRMVRREIRQEDGQFCVYSETGRAFGCYESQDQALERLAQIEQFAGQLAKQTVQELVAWHDQAHKVGTVTEAIKTVHDLVEDELEIVHRLAYPYEFSDDQKLAMIEGEPGGLLTKAAEYQYTLGPAYVPNREDAHGEWADPVTLQRAMWDWVRKGDRSIYLQHSDKVAGEMVELLTWPFPIQADLAVPNQGVSKFTFPANTPFLGVVWEDWAWDLVKQGELRGYSIGGKAERVEADLPDHELL